MDKPTCNCKNIKNFLIILISHHAYFRISRKSKYFFVLLASGVIESYQSPKKTEHEILISVYLNLPKGHGWYDFKLLDDFHT